MKMACDKKSITSAFWLTNQMLGNKHAFSKCYVFEVMYAMSTSTVHSLNTINKNTALCLLGY